jgi:hypothetical protein
VTRSSRTHVDINLTITAAATIRGDCQWRRVCDDLRAIHNNTEPPNLVIGRIVYLAPGSQKWLPVAEDLNHANGIGVSPDQKTLYVSETVGNCILKFSINDDGSLGKRSNFALLNLLVFEITAGEGTTNVASAKAGSICT